MDSYKVSLVQQPCRANFVILIVQINKTETQSLSDLSEVTQVVSGGAAIQTPVKLVLYPPSLLTTRGTGNKAQLPPVGRNWEPIVSVGQSTHGWE